MSDEQARKRAESENNDEDVIAHSFVIEEPGEDDPERKRKRKQAEDAESDELGRKRK
jgi:hypothetical protein